VIKMTAPDRSFIRFFDQATKLKRIPYAHSSFCFSSDSKEIFYIKSRSPNATDRSTMTLQLQSGQWKEKRLTRIARVYSVSASPMERA
jgi:hypothetical protein